MRKYSSLNSANVIDSSKIKADFEQTGGSCVLASYAIAHNYFTSMPIRVCFEDYCRHFKLPFSDAKEAEQKYAEHFDLEWKERGCKGYEVMVDLHNYSSAAAFVVGREHFNSTFYNESSPSCNELQKCLRTREAILNITYTVGIHFHSVSVFADKVLFKKDTMKTGLESFGTLTDLGNLRDALLHIKINDHV